MPLRMARPPTASACTTISTRRCVPRMACRRRWRAVSSARSGPPTKGCGPSGIRTWKRAKRAGRRNASRAWTNHPTTSRPRVTYVSGRDFTFKAAGQVSVLTLAGRIVLPYQGWSRHVAWLQQGAQIGGAKLWYDRARKRFYLLVSLTITTPDPTPADLVSGGGHRSGPAVSGHR